MPTAMPVGASEERGGELSPRGGEVELTEMRVGRSDDITMLQQPQCWQPSAQRPSGSSPGHWPVQLSALVVVSMPYDAPVAAATGEVVKMATPTASTINMTPNRRMQKTRSFRLSCKVFIVAG